MFGLGGGAVLGALHRRQRVEDDGAVAVVEVVATLAARIRHGSFVAPLTDGPPSPRTAVGPYHAWRLFRSGPAEFVQPLVVDAEVMGDLVDDGHHHLLHDLGFGIADVEQRVAVDRDRVRQ